MAKIACIPSEFLDPIATALKKGDISLVDLYNMDSSAERTAIWESYAPPDVAKFINTNFEKAAASQDDKMASSTRFRF